MKIRFDTSDSSLSGHNFKFSTTADGTNDWEQTLQQMLQLRVLRASSGSYTELEITPETLGIEGQLELFIIIVQTIVVWEVMVIYH